MNLNISKREMEDLEFLLSSFDLFKEAFDDYNHLFFKLYNNTLPYKTREALQKVQSGEDLTKEDFEGVLEEFKNQTKSYLGSIIKEEEYQLINSFVKEDPSLKFATKDDTGLVKLWRKVPSYKDGEWVGGYYVAVNLPLEDGTPQGFDNWLFNDMVVTLRESTTVRDASKFLESLRELMSDIQKNAHEYFNNYMYMKSNNYPSSILAYMVKAQELKNDLSTNLFQAWQQSKQYISLKERFPEGSEFYYKGATYTVLSLDYDKYILKVKVGDTEDEFPLDKIQQLVYRKEVTFPENIQESSVISQIESASTIDELLKAIEGLPEEELLILAMGIEETPRIKLDYSHGDFHEDQIEVKNWSKPWLVWDDGKIKNITKSKFEELKSFLKRRIEGGN